MDPALQRHLLRGERVLWSGRPGQGILFQPNDTYLIPFSLAWGGFALFWNLSVWSTGAPLTFRLFGLPFLVMGLYFVAGRFVHDAMIRRHQLYAVTDRRVLSVTEGRSTVLRSLDVDQLPTLELRERPDGSGTIRFGLAAINPTGRMGFSQIVPALDSRVQFLEIGRVRDVYALLQRPES